MVDLMKEAKERFPANLFVALFLGLVVGYFVGVYSFNGVTVEGTSGEANFLKYECQPTGSMRCSGSWTQRCDERSTKSWGLMTRWKEWKSKQYCTYGCLNGACKSAPVAAPVKKANGQTCTAATQCTSNYCVAGICSATATGAAAATVPTTIRCGDRIRNGNEACDSTSQLCTTTDGYPGNQTCLADCTSYGACNPLPRCGDGIKNGNEACDGDRVDCSRAGYSGFNICKADCTGYDTSACQTFCTDSDNAINYFVAGTAAYGTIVSPDTCVTAQQYAGTVNGRAVYNTVLTGEVMEYYCISSSVIGNQKRACPLGCQGNACINYPTCSDTDGGDNIIAQGTTCKTEACSTDYCSNSNIVEFNCVNDMINYTIQECRMGCYAGKCN